MTGAGALNKIFRHSEYSSDRKRGIRHIGSLEEYSTSHGLKISDCPSDQKVGLFRAVWTGHLTNAAGYRTDEKFC